MKEKAAVALITVLLLLVYFVAPVMGDDFGTVTVKNSKGEDVTRDNHKPGNDEKNSTHEEEEKEPEKEESGLLNKLNPVTQGKVMVGEGFMYFLELLGDSGFQVGTNDSTGMAGVKENYGQAVAVVYSLATIEFDPYQNDFVVEFQLRSALVGAYLMLMFILLGALDVNIYAATSARNVDRAYILSNRYHVPINEYVLTLIESAAMISIGYVVLRTTLLIELLITQMIMFQVLDRIAPTGGNIVMYLMMSLCYLIIGFAIAYRILIVGMFHASYIAFVGLYCFGITRPAAISAFWYYMKMLFLRPIIIGITTLGVGMISAMHINVDTSDVQYIVDNTSAMSAHATMPASFVISGAGSLVVHFIVQPLLYSALIIILSIVCIAMIVGVKNIINASRYALKRYAYGALR